MSDNTYEDEVLQAAETRRDLDVVLHPMFGALKKAFGMVFPQFPKSDFKKLSDLRYYTGGYPSPTTPPKEDALADQVASMLRLQALARKNTLSRKLKERGIGVTVTNQVEDSPITLSDDDQKELTGYLGEAGISGHHETKSILLGAILDRAQALQKEICETADTIKVEAAERVEEKYKIKKGNFVKAVNLTAMKLRRGEGVVAEKVDDIMDNADNLAEALRPLLPHS